MADDQAGSVAGEMEEPRRSDPPPPLTDIRVAGPKPRGLNKPAILVAVGGALAIVLVLASGAFSSGPAGAAAETKPMMSDPARPEMAKSAVRDLPVTYAEAGPLAAPRSGPPELGPPLPGDVAAFAPDTAPDRISAPAPYASGDYADIQAPGGAPQEVREARRVQEADQADRSTLFFALREEPSKPALGQQVAAPSAKQTPVRTQGGVTRSALHPGAIIAASLITGINSETPGPVIAQVTQSIHDSATGRTLLIPQGARLIGDYRSSAKYGQTRLAIAWSRLIMPDGDEVALGEAAADPSGAAGVSGKVDNHWADVFGAAALGTFINIGVAAAEDQNLAYDGIGPIERDPANDALNDGLQQSAAIVTNRIVERGLAVPPTIRIEAGKRISIIVTRRLDFLDPP